MNNKNFTFGERIKLEYHLNTNLSCTAIKISESLSRSRSSIYYELRHYSIKIPTSSEKFNHTTDIFKCERLKHFPFVCNGCARSRCSHRSIIYDAHKANEAAIHNLKVSRSELKKKKEKAKIIDKTISPLLLNGQSIANAINIVDNCDVSESTIRRYIDLGILNVKRIDLPRAIKFPSKKEYKTKSSPLSSTILFNRTYEDYCKYMELNPEAKVIQVDSVIGKLTDKTALLTIFFVNSKLQTGILYNRSNNGVIQILRDLYNVALEYGIKLFDVVLTDNGSEFKKLYELEKDENDNKICNVFYCDPYKSYQKAECEKNHGFFRRIWPKGRTLDKFEQPEINEIFSHINSYPRASLNNKSPYDLFILEYDEIILLIFNIIKVYAKDIKLIDYKKWTK